MKIPIFISDEVDLGDNIFVTKEHLRSHILLNYNDIADKYCISKRFNKVTGEVEKNYAWHSIIDVLNSEGHSSSIIQHFHNGFRETEE